MVGNVCRACNCCCPAVQRRRLASQSGCCKLQVQQCIACRSTVGLLSAAGRHYMKARDRECLSEAAILAEYTIELMHWRLGLQDHRWQ